jgi:glycosyltransferase involved in cell wall biosynthesis
MNIIVVASLAPSLLNFRGPLLEAMVKLGHRVTACAPEYDERIVRGLSDIGVSFRIIPMDRVGLNPLADLKTMYALASMFRRERPDLILAYTQKPIIYSGLAARLTARGTRMVMMMTGLGYVCTEGGGIVRRLVRPLMARMFRLASAQAHRVLVFNGHDAADMRRYAMAAKGREIVQVPGSGVDVRHFAEKPLPQGRPTLLMIGRLLKDKGLYEYVEAARLVRQSHPSARFQLLGPFDANPSAVNRDDVRRWEDEGLIEYLGATDDVRPFLEQATVFVLPSYREGLPRSTLEAMATGRPVITTDAPGCSETVVDGDNGFLVPVGDAAALATAMSRLLASPELVARMGRRSREMAVSRYSVERVNAVLLELMGLTDRPVVDAETQDSRVQLKDPSLSQVRALG